jgi:hypothetical protein
MFGPEMLWQWQFFRTSLCDCVIFEIAFWSLETPLNLIQSSTSYLSFLNLLLLRPIAISFDAILIVIQLWPPGAQE